MTSPVRKAVSESVLFQKSSLDKGWKELIREYRQEAEDYAKQLFELRRQNSGLYQETLQQQIVSPSNKFKSGTVYEVASEKKEKHEKQNDKTPRKPSGKSEKKATERKPSLKTERGESEGKNDKHYDIKHEELPRRPPASPAHIQIENISHELPSDSSKMPKVTKTENEYTVEMSDELSELSSTEEEEVKDKGLDFLNDTLNKIKGSKDGKGVSYTKIRNLVLQSSTNVSPEPKEMHQKPMAVVPVPHREPIVIEKQDNSIKLELDHMKEMIDSERKFNEKRLQDDEVRLRELSANANSNRVTSASADPTIPFLITATKDQLLDRISKQQEKNEEKEKSIKEAIDKMSARLAQSEIRSRKEAEERLLDRLYKPAKFNASLDLKEHNLEAQVEQLRKQNEDLKNNIDTIALSRLLDESESNRPIDFQLNFELSEDDDDKTDFDSFGMDSNERIFSIPLPKIHQDSIDGEWNQETDVETEQSFCIEDLIDQKGNLDIPVTKQPQNENTEPPASLKSSVSMPENHVRVSAELLKQVETESAILINQKNQLKEENQRLQYEKQQIEEQLQASRQTAENRINDLEADNERLRLECANYVEILHDYTRQFTVIKPGEEQTHPFNIMSVYQDLKDRLESTAALNEELRSKNEEKDIQLEALKQQVEKQRKALEAQINKNQDITLKLKVDRDMHTNEKQALTKRVEALVRERDSARRTMKRIGDSYTAIFSQ